MADLLQEAFEEAQQLSTEEQNAIATLLLAEISSEQRWDELFASSSEALASLAKEARPNIGLVGPRHSIRTNYDIENHAKVPRVFIENAQAGTRTSSKALQTYFAMTPSTPASTSRKSALSSPSTRFAST